VEGLLISLRGVAVLPMRTPVPRTAQNRPVAEVLQEFDGRIARAVVAVQDVLGDAAGFGEYEPWAVVPFFLL
jgi:hypothetical protein